MNDLEHAVRATLQALATDAGAPGGPGTAERAIARQRRDRRRRAGLWATAAATVVIAAGVPAALGAWTAPADRDGPVSGVTTSTATTPSLESPPPETAPASAPGDFNVRTGPPEPELGVAYPFDLLTHCGIGWTSFGGRDWHPVQPEPVPAPLPDPDGITTVDGYTTGTMTLVDEDLLRFTITEPYVEGRGRTIDFVPLPETAPRPLCD
jgi:hypothetical protein